MLTRIENEHLYWTCLLRDPDDDTLLSCGQERHAHISEVRYQRPQTPTEGRAVLDVRRAPQAGRGAVLVLPRCPECGTQLFLKADYSLKEAWRCVMEVEAGALRVVAMRPQHARNLVALAMLYERGMAEHAPVLPMPSEAMIEAGVRQGLPIDSVWALWFGYQAVQAWAGQTGKVLEVGQTEQLLLSAPH